MVTGFAVGSSSVRSMNSTEHGSSSGCFSGVCDCGLAFIEHLAANGKFAVFCSDDVNSGGVDMDGDVDNNGNVDNDNDGSDTVHDD